ncbi:hypothetical protein HYW75_01965 [Candidatus Pacearchaeota archaeon]|nr:hypothetical protein [Candidatus Pacearchaeota archaeon]
MPIEFDITDNESLLRLLIEYKQCGLDLDKFSFGDIQLRNPHMPITPENIVSSDDRKYIEKLIRECKDFEARINILHGIAYLYIRNPLRYVN